MSAGRRKRPQKALTRKDFRYKRDWKYHKENEQEDNEFEGEFPESSILLLGGFTMVFFKLVALGSLEPLYFRDETPADRMHDVINYALAFVAIAVINKIGKQMAGFEGKKTRITGIVIKTISYIGFATLFYFLMYKGVN
ncbi:hypothetical protein ACWA2C_28160 [Priestia megaterium]